MRAAVRNPRNTFQRLMARWDELHPYSALSIVRVRRPADAARLRAAAQAELEELGIARIHVEPGGRGYRFEPGPATVAVEALPETDARPDRVILAERAAEELNRPFLDDGSLPIRFFLLPRAGLHYAAIVYRHWIGDEHALCRLLLRILARSLGKPVAEELGAFLRESPAYREVFGAMRRLEDWAGHGVDVVRGLLRMRLCHSPRNPSCADPSIEVEFPPLEPNVLDRLQRESKTRGATINDLLLALLAEAVDRQTRDRAGNQRRRDLALSSIVSLRRRAREGLEARAGLYLSYFNVFCRNDIAGDFPRLVDTIRRQRVRIMEERRYLAGLLEIELANRLWPWIAPAERARYFGNQQPAAAGLTNFVVPDRWLDGGLGEEVEFWGRATSAGPMTPLVLAATTAGGRFSIGLAGRRNGFSPDARNAIARRLADRLNRL